MGRGSGMLVRVEWVWTVREVQPCWYWRSWRTVDARWWRYTGCGESFKVVFKTSRDSSRADAGGRSVIAEGAMTGYCAGVGSQGWKILVSAF